MKAVLCGRGGKARLIMAPFVELRGGSGFLKAGADVKHTVSLQGYFGDDK